MSAVVPPISRAGRLRRWALGLLPLLLLIVAWRVLEPRRLWQAVRGARLGWLAAGTFVNAAGHGVHALRWRALLQPIATEGRRVRRRDCFVAMSLGYAGGALLPARLGEWIRVRHLARVAGLPQATVLGSVLLDHLVHAVAMMPLWALLWFMPGLPPWIRRSSLVVLPVVAVALAVALTWAWRLEPEARPRWRLLRRLRQLRQGVVALRSVRAVRWAVLWAALGWGAEAAVIACSLAAFGIDPEPARVLLVLLAVNAAVALPSTPANAGTLELGVVLALGALGVSREVAVAAAVGYHLAQLASVWAAAALCWPASRRAAG